MVRIAKSIKKLMKGRWGRRVCPIHMLIGYYSVQRLQRRAADAGRSWFPRGSSKPGTKHTGSIPVSLEKTTRWHQVSLRHPSCRSACIYRKEILSMPGGHSCAKNNQALLLWQAGRAISVNAASLFLIFSLFLSLSLLNQVRQEHAGRQTAPQSADQPVNRDERLN